MIVKMQVPVVWLEKCDDEFICHGYTGKFVNVNVVRVSERFGVQKHPDRPGWSATYMKSPSTFTGAYAGRVAKIYDAKRLALLMEKYITDDMMSVAYQKDSRVLNEIKNIIVAELGVKVYFD